MILEGVNDGGVIEGGDMVVQEGAELTERSREQHTATSHYSPNNPTSTDSAPS